MVFVAESWRQVLAGKAAARLIYVESVRNAVVYEDAAQKGHLHDEIINDAWQTHGIQVAPLLTMEVSQFILIAYHAIPFATHRATPTDFESHSQKFRTVAHWMLCIERKGRLKLLLELLNGNPTLPSANRIEQELAMMT